MFNYLTVASRLYADLSIGRDEEVFPKYIARPDFVRGYDRNNSFNSRCPIVGANPSNCNAVQLLGSRVAVETSSCASRCCVASSSASLPVELPPIDGLFFFDAGVAWSQASVVFP